MLCCAVPWYMEGEWLRSWTIARRAGQRVDRMRRHGAGEPDRGAGAGPEPRAREWFSCSCLRLCDGTRVCSNE